MKARGFPKIGQFLEMVARFCDLQYLQLNNEKEKTKHVLFGILMLK